MMHSLILPCLQWLGRTAASQAIYSGLNPGNRTITITANRLNLIFSLKSDAHSFVFKNINIKICESTSGSNI
jgi:hypothetical protein